MDTFSLDDFENPPPPPRYLYKYLSAERVGNVLEGGTVRFTPLLDTNDTFEVRSTFDKLAGPKMLSVLRQEALGITTEESVREVVAEKLKEIGHGSFSSDEALKLIEEHYGYNVNDLIGLLQQQMQEAVESVLVPHFNNPENGKKLLEKLGRDLLCFSLSERMDNSLMWAMYADNNAGFVVAFDTENAWFHQRKSGEKTRLQKVAYFDGKLDELLENPQAAFISKVTDWVHEREWRLYIKNGEADLTVGNADDPIQLLKFPPEAVDRIILGAKTRPEIADRIRDAVASRYPHAPVMRAVPNRQSHTYDEVSE